MPYNIINLIDIHGKEAEGQILSDLELYECSYNKDVESFLKEKSYHFAKSGLAQTHLVYTSFKQELILCGYYALATKWIKLKKKAVPNSRLRSKFNHYGSYDRELEEYSIVVPLIGQIGKNYYLNYNKLISGDELLELALRTVRTAQYIIGGGKFAYLECEDEPKLIDFYQRNGFWEFGKRKLEKDETGLKGKHLIQMIRYFEDCEVFPNDL